ncbi:MAG: hypothetical protein WCS01_06110, partial [bacterium]
MIRSGRLATSALLAFGLLAGLGILQVRWSREVVFSAGSPQEADWTKAGGAVAKRGVHGAREDEIIMPGVSPQAPDAPIPAFVVGIPRDLFGYRVNVGVRQIDQQHPPIIDAEIAGRPLGDFSVAPYYWPEKVHGRDCHEFSISREALKEPVTALRLSNRGGYWMGRILIIPYGSLRPLLLYGIPIL